MSGIVSPNNAAKEWIFRQLAEKAAAGPFRVCDLACGSGSSWRAFLSAHPNVAYVGSDTDAKAVAHAKTAFVDLANASFAVADAQQPPKEEGAFDVVTSLSSLEHVVDIGKFLDTVFLVLKSGGVAYVNYDNGHFRAPNLRERIMVPVSQMLARFGVEGPYMKEVDDREVARLIRERGGTVADIRKQNLPALKGFMKAYRTGTLSSDALEAWFAFEDRLNAAATPEQLDPIMGSTTIVFRKA